MNGENSVKIVGTVCEWNFFTGKFAVKSGGNIYNISADGMLKDALLKAAIKNGRITIDVEEFDDFTASVNEVIDRHKEVFEMLAEDD